ncbi:MAG: T9SS type A sorting domain-containing protein [Bacteroidetes bacterium]|nr:T9SS type A sorting domain-containing protein [Bacteroidota bacterium]
MFSQILFNQKSVNNIEIDLSPFAPGAYFVGLKTNNGIVYKKLMLE